MFSSNAGRHFAGRNLIHRMKWPQLEQFFTSTL